MFINQNSVLVKDDEYCVFWDGGIKPKLTLHYGTWCLIVENILMYCIPVALKINMQDWAASAGVVFKSFIVTLIIIYFYKFLEFKKIHYVYGIVLSFLAYCTLFILYYKTEYTDFIIYEGFFRFILPSCLYVVLLYYLYKIYNRITVNKFFIAALAVLTASASEVTGVISILSVFFLIFLLKSKISNLIIDEKYTFKNYLIVLFVLIIGFVILVTRQGFYCHYSEKVHDIIPLFAAVKYLPEFFSLYIRKMIYDYSIVYITFILLVIFNIFFGRKGKNLPDIIFSSVIIISIMFFAFMFIFAGKTSYNDNFWIDHKDIYSIYIPFYITAILILFSNLVINTNKKINIVIIISLSCILVSNFFFYTRYLTNTLKNIKAYSYLRDKMYLFCCYKKIPILLPNFAKFMTASYVFANYYIKPQTFKKYIEGDVTDGEEAYRIECMSKNYYPVVYNSEINNQIITEEEITGAALIRYKELGGNYKELETNHADYKFTNLSDKSFVLNLN